MLCWQMETVYAVFNFAARILSKLREFYNVIGLHAYAVRKPGIEGATSRTFLLVAENGLVLISCSMIYLSHRRVPDVIPVCSIKSSVKLL